MVEECSVLKRMIDSEYVPNNGLKQGGKNRISLLVTGPARSGTTLMHLLLAFGFEDTCLFFPERHCGTLNIHAQSEKKWKVYKSCCDSWHLEEIMTALDKIYIIYMIRDPRDLLTSKNKCHNWEYPNFPPDIKRNYNFLFNDDLMKKFGNRILKVKFEDLVTSPDEIQSLIAHKVGMTVQECFSTCYGDFISIKHDEYDEYIENLITEKGGDVVRPIESCNNGRWKSDEHIGRIREQLNKDDNKELVCKMLTDLGYEEDDSWLEEYGI